MALYAYILCLNLLFKNLNCENFFQLAWGVKMGICSSNPKPSMDLNSHACVKCYSACQFLFSLYICFYIFWWSYISSYLHFTWWASSLMYCIIKLSHSELHEILQWFLKCSPNPNFWLSTSLFSTPLHSWQTSSKHIFSLFIINFLILIWLNSKRDPCRSFLQEIIECKKERKERASSRKRKQHKRNYDF